MKIYFEHLTYFLFFYWLVKLGFNNLFLFYIQNQIYFLFQFQAFSNKIFYSKLHSVTHYSLI